MVICLSWKRIITPQGEPGWKKLKKYGSAYFSWWCYIWNFRIVALSIPGHVQSITDRRTEMAIFRSQKKWKQEKCLMVLWVFHWRINVTYHFEKGSSKGQPQTMPDRPDITILKDRIFPWKVCPKIQFLSYKMLVTDVVIGKYWEEAQPLKLQPA